MKSFYCFLLLCVAFCLNANAQIPRSIAYQGVLTDSLGNPKADGSYTITFLLYDTAN